VLLPTLIATLVFIYLHLCTYFYGGPGEHRLRYIAGEYLIGFLLAPLNLSALGFLIFAFFVTAFSMPLRMARYVIFGSVTIFMIETWLLGHNWQTMASVMTPAILLAITALYTAYTGQQQMALRRSNEEIMRLATLAERERIGRDLHDLLGHTLSVMALKSSWRASSSIATSTQRARRSPRWSAWRAIHSRRCAMPSPAFAAPRSMPSSYRPPPCSKRRDSR
jgi:two-component system sensor histidine kinase DesK